MRYKDKNKITALQNAVIDQIIQAGYQNLSVAKIANCAGVSVATLYIYYRNKKDMLSAVYMKIKDTIDPELFADLNHDESVGAQFRLILQNYAHAIGRHPKEAAVMRVFNANPELIEADVYKAGMNRGKPLQKIYRQGVEMGLFRDVSPELMLPFTFSPLDQLAETRFRQGTVLAQSEIDSLVEMAWAACKR